MKTLNNEIMSLLSNIAVEWPMAIPRRQMATVVDELGTPACVGRVINDLWYPAERIVADFRKTGVLACSPDDIESAAHDRYIAGELAGAVVGFAAGLLSAGIPREEIVRRMTVFLSDLAHDDQVVEDNSATAQ